MHSRLEHYLEELAARLHSLPPARRNEELREMRTHLLSALEAHQELGETEQTALEATLRQFGPPAEVAQGVTRAWRRAQRGWRDTVKDLLSGAAALWGSYALCWFPTQYLDGHPNALPALLPHLEVAFYVLLFGVSGLLGGLYGRHFARAVVKGLSWGAFLGYVVPAVVFEVFQAGADSDLVGVLLILLLQAVCLTGAAWMGSQWRGRVSPVRE